jgi:tripartite-type tricarboxylate transporter receptor subunit TctC
MLNDLLAGRIQFTIDNIAAPLAHIKAGTIIALGVTGNERFPDLPDVPLIKDTMKDFEVGGTWNGLFAPAGVPEEILRKIASQVQQAVASPDVSTRIKEFSLKPVGNTPAEFNAYFKRDYEL